MSSTDPVQLNKYISSSGYCSRREADRLIEQGRVAINGNIALPGARVLPGDKVYVDDELLKKKPAGKQDSFIIAFNKPVNITSTTDEKDPSNIIRFINHPKRIFPIGRLDKDSEGLIFLTNDGDLVNKILRAGNRHEKEYIVAVNKKLGPDFAATMSRGVRILDTTTLPCKVKVLGSKSFSIILTQGLNRQIRRMCHALGYEVVRLQRTRIMHIRLGNIAVGKWRYLSAPEMEEMQQQLKDSRSEG
ncbi:MAG TPA: pseudouridine synthase [Lacibacter sp.]|nr:pseudouridine synthase [Lacibacter sp.]HMO88109.1 pseudouridine synthase [Lacibacter sp.]